MTDTIPGIVEFKLQNDESCGSRFRIGEEAIFQCLRKGLKMTSNVFASLCAECENGIFQEFEGFFLATAYCHLTEFWAERLLEKVLM